jgi:hypothetical protein
MRQRLFALVVVAALLALGAFASVAAAAGVRVYVSPSSGKPTTKFVVRFRTPATPGVGLHHRYELYANGARGSRCTSSVSIAIGAIAAGSPVRLTLKPAHRSGTWCADKFNGRIVEYLSPICQPLKTAIICPDIVIAPQTIGRFSFSVRMAGSSSTSSGTGTHSGGPSFAGLQSATTCIPPGPKALPSQRTYELTWSAATDPLTPSSQIVYEIFYSPTSGGENYSTPTWTTPAGVTQYSVTISNSTPAYFVVRARGSDGLVDHNTVERVGVDSCTNA